jgi:hypothetical protein
MSDLLEATQVQLVEKIGDRDVTFKFLTVYDRAELLRPVYEERKTAWDARRERRIANLKAAEITGEQMYNELENFDDIPPAKPTEQDWIDLVNSPDSDMAVYTRSLLKTYGADEAEKLARELTPKLSRKAEICGLQIVNKPDSPAEGGADPNAIPPTYQAPAEQTS